MKKIAFFIMVLAVSGCSTTQNIEVQTTRSWENHYYNTNDFYKATGNIELQEGESIWVLSNASLSRVLKNVREKK